MQLSGSKLPFPTLRLLTLILVCRRPDMASRNQSAEAEEKMKAFVSCLLVRASESGEMKGGETLISCEPFLNSF